VPPPVAQGKRAAALRQFLFSSGSPEKGKIPAGSVNSHLTAKCGRSIHDKYAVEITASSVLNSNANYVPGNPIDLENTDRYFSSDNKPGQWIFWDFKTFRIGPRRYTLQICNFASISPCLTDSVAEKPDDCASSREIDWRENNSDFKDVLAMRMFPVSQPESLRMAHLRQTGRNHDSSNFLVLSVFVFFGTVAQVQQTVSRKAFLYPLQEASTSWKRAQS
jgi:hypothetical protein